MNTTSSNDSLPDYRFFEFKRIVEGYLLSIVCLLGLFGNALTCIILSNRSMRTSITNIYIFALSCASSFVLIGFLLTHGIRSTFAAETFYRHIFIRVFPIHVTCILIQIYLTAAVAFDRFILICLPFRSRQWRTERRAVCTVIGICLFCTIYCIPFWFEFTLERTDQTERIVLSQIGSHPLFRLLMRQYLYFIFVFLCPLTIIFISKMLIIKKLYVIRQRKRLLGTSMKKTRSSNAINFLLLAIVFLFLATQLPYFVFNVLYAWIGARLMVNRLARQYLTISNLLSVINASSTFLLYAFFDKKFREIGEHVFCARPLPSAADPLYCTGASRQARLSLPTSSHKRSNNSLYRASASINPHLLPSINRDSLPSTVRSPTPTAVWLHLGRKTSLAISHHGYPIRDGECSSFFSQ